jgi:diguanylate cyclase
MTATTDNTSEFLRLALPLMSRHGVPVTPKNYAVWYEYVAGANSALQEEINRRMAEKEPFSEAANDDLYQRFVSECDVAAFSRVRAEMRQLLREVGAALASAGSDADRYGLCLNGTVSEIERAGSLEEIRNLLRTLVDETRAIRESSNALRANFDAKMREIQVLQQELDRARKRAMTDTLTGLANREAFYEALDAAMGNASDESQELCLLLIDIDHFKQINDSHGHLVGDRVIRFVANTVKRLIKGKDTAARFGGEEFTIVLPDTPCAGANALAENIRKAIADARLVRSDTREPLSPITVSIGVSCYRNGENMNALIDRADQAVYSAKAAGRNRVVGDLEYEMGHSLERKI